MKNIDFWFIPLLTIVLLGACKNSTNLADADTDKASHLRMLAILDSISQNTDPMTCLSRNLKRADMIKQSMDGLSGEQYEIMKFNYAAELLKGGKGEEAVLNLKEVIDSYSDVLNEQTKILYQLLALGYMQLGEQANCINSHGEQSCTIPLEGDGIYKMPSGPENAIKIYNRILDKFPDDLQARWLLNIANMALGTWPEGVPPKFRFPASVFASKMPKTFTDIAIPLGLDVLGISGGICIEDFDNDGNLDLFMTAYGLDDQCRFFKNNGDGTFTDRTKEANLMGIVSGLNVIQADYDNDGDRDLLILRGAWLPQGTHPNSLLRNNGDGTFTDVTIKAGLLSFHPTQTADWADYDGDGWLDLFIGNESMSIQTMHPCELYHNNGNGTFTNVAHQLGLDYKGFFKAVSWGDINNDQRPDLYLSNLFGANVLLINRGGASPDNWKFEDISQKTQTQFPQSCFPAFFFDYNNDGLDDIFVSAYPPSYDDPTSTPVYQYYLGQQPDGDYMRLYQNQGNEHFQDVSRSIGMNYVTYGMGNNFGDLDNDGFLDIILGTGKPDLGSLIPNRVFHNIGGKRFEDISMSGFSHIQKGHGVAFGDIDNDGDQDIYLVAGGAFEGDLAHNLFYENAGNRNHWITLFLEGVSCNRDAMGAKIKVEVQAKNGSIRNIYATVGSGGTFGASSLRQEIGLGDASKIVKIEVQWPKPGVPNTIYQGLEMDNAYKLKEGNAQAEKLNLKKIAFPAS